MSNEKNPPVYLCIFQSTINGKLAQTEITTIKGDPLHSRSIRRDCEAAARTAFVELGKQVGVYIDGTHKIKCVEITKFMPPEDDDGSGH